MGHRRGNEIIDANSRSLSEQAFYHFAQLNDASWELPLTVPASIDWPDPGILSRGNRETLTPELENDDDVENDDADMTDDELNQLAGLLSDETDGESDLEPTRSTQDLQEPDNKTATLEDLNLQAPIDWFAELIAAQMAQDAVQSTGVE